MKKIFVAIAALALTASASTSCRYIKIHKGALIIEAAKHEASTVGKGEPVTQRRALASLREPTPFKSVAVNCLVDVDIVKDESVRELVATMPQDLLDRLETRIADSCLYISFKLKDAALINTRSSKIVLHCDALEGVTVLGSSDVRVASGILTGNCTVGVSGSGDIDVEEAVCDSLNVVVNGSGDIEIDNIECNTLTASVKGSGDISLSGKAGSADYKVSGSGDIDARKLEAERTSETVRGSGDIRRK